jgi:hypothetical protein
MIAVTCKHFHNREKWIGKRAVQTATNWGNDTLTSFQAISGNNAYGTDADDEAQVLGTGDTPVFTGGAKYDLHRILVTDVSNADPFKLRFVWSDTSMAAGIAAENYSEVIIKLDKTKADCLPLEFMMPRIDSGTDMVWCQAWNGTDNATIDFLVALHEYTG